MNHACPSPVELTRELSNGANQQTIDHLEQCEHCAAEWASLSRVTELAAQLPAPEVSEQRAKALRSALLGSATAVSSPARSGVPRALAFATAAAAALALVLGGYLLFRTPDSSAEQATAPDSPVSEVFRAKIHAHAGAVHKVVGSQPDEIVRLTEGMVTFEVEPLSADERFRVVTGDAEVEVKLSSSVFDVSVATDELVAVHVISGEVIVRPADGEPTVLAAGEWWRQQTEIAAAPATVEAPAPKPAAASSSAPRPVFRRAANTSRSIPTPAAQPTPEPVQPAAPSYAASAASPAPPVHQPSPAQQAFESGWTALRNGDATTAAAEFAKASGARDPIAEDAGYWEAVAFARSGQHHHATRALKTFIQRHPGSPRAGEASVMLGWSLFHSGNLAGAETRFRAALNDRSGRVRSSAQKGLQAIQQRRQATTP